MSETGQCRDCRWWESIDAIEAGMGICTMMGTLDAALPIRLHLSFGHGDAIIVGELFGCVKFEASDE
jgi:hypothetical protein